MNEESPCNNKASPGSPGLKSSSSAAATATTNKEQDRFLPIANVGRIMKKVIPPNGKISKEAKGTVQECVSEFISFITSEASDKCQGEKRKTVNGDDIIWAISALGFENYVDPLKCYLQKYREIEGEKLNVPKQQRSHHDHHQSRLQHNNNIANINNIPLNTSVYSSTNLISHQPPPPYVTSDQTFSIPFSSTSLQKPLQPQDNTVGRW
ncbi:hypothetical protein K1719_014585 [Acacia pycnantha]|nr:hypothetical protein K1719_014585 [Acacia pycnantha]